MNNDQIKRGYDTMTPDEAARQRMLNRLMKQGGQNVKKEYSAQPARSKGWLGTLAAVLVLAVLATGLVTILRSQAPAQLQDDPTETTVPKGNAEEEIEAFMSTPFYQASVEYYEWLQNGESGTYVNRMTKQQEIADRYGLKHYDGDDRGTDSYEHFLEAVELKSFLREDVPGTVWAIDSCWWYDQDRFNVGGTVAMNWEGSPRTVPVDFNFYRTTPDYLLPALGEMGDLEDYDCWVRELPYGKQLILACGAEKSYVIDYSTAVVNVIVVDNWKRDESDRAMTREALEAFSNLFRYEMVQRTEWGNDETTGETVPEDVVYPIQPIVDDNSTVAVSLEGSIWQESTGTAVINVIIYVHDQFAYEDIAQLEVGQFIYLRGQNTEITSLAIAENGDVLINGGAEERGTTLRTDGDGIYYEVMGTGTKYWQEYMDTNVPLSPDFQFCDYNGTCGLVYTAESFVEMEFDGEFTPQNTCLVLKDGCAISMERHCIEEYCEEDTHHDEHHDGHDDCR